MGATSQDIINKQNTLSGSPAYQKQQEVEQLILEIQTELRHDLVKKRRYFVISTNNEYKIVHREITNTY